MERCFLSKKKFKLKKSEGLNNSENSELDQSSFPICKSFAHVDFFSQSFKILYQHNNLIENYSEVENLK